MLNMEDKKFKFLDEHFFYEVQQLLVGVHVIRHPLPFWVNIKLEIFLLHTRGLYEFFYNDHDPKKYADDACAYEFCQDLEKWKNERPVKTKYITDALDQINKELAHLTCKRHAGPAVEKLNTNDIWPIKEHLFKVIKVFLDNVPQGARIMEKINELETKLLTPEGAG